MISFGVGTLIVGALRRELPDRERPFRLPGKDVIPLLAFYAANMIIYWPDGRPTRSCSSPVFLINAVVAVGVYYLAMRTRLPRTRIEGHFREAENEPAEWARSFAVVYSSTGRRATSYIPMLISIFTVPRWSVRLAS